MTTHTLAVRKPLLRVLFVDLNGTIVDDWYASLAGANACLCAYGAEQVSLEGYIRAVALHGDYQRFYHDRKVYASRDELYSVFLPAYTQAVNNFTDVRIFPDVFETLDRLRQCNVEVHILTAARGDLVEKIVHAIGIRAHCASFHSHVHNKEAQIRAVIDGMDIEHSACAMIGDVPADVIHAQRAGIAGIRYVNRDVPEELFEGVHPTYTVHTFSEILAHYAIV